MAITNNGTVNSLTDNEVPAGYTRPTVTTFTDWTDEGTRVLTVLKATVENATATTTMANIIADAAIGITKQVTDILAAERLASATVTAYADLIGLTNNFSDINGAGVYLQATAASYQCTVKIYTKTA